MEQGERRPELFAEFRRVLAPGGVVMLLFQIGGERLHRTEAYGQRVDVSWYRQRPEEVGALLREAGFAVVATAVREAEGSEKTPHGYVMARRSGAGAGQRPPGWR
jgi:hypothetical protein